MCLLEESRLHFSIRACSVSTRVVAYPDAREAIVYRCWEEMMKRIITLALLGVMLLFGGATRSGAEVKRVEMHIGGYLCGN